MEYQVSISETVDQKLQLSPPEVGRLNVGDVIVWTSELDTATCQVGNLYPEYCFAPGTVTIGPGGVGRVLMIAPSDSGQNVTYWCTPTAPQDTQAATQQGDESYTPVQGIIIVDPPLPGDDDHKDKHKHKKQEREAVIG